jgi:hypothetical protein
VTEAHEQDVSHGCRSSREGAIIEFYRPKSRHRRRARLAPASVQDKCLKLSAYICWIQQGAKRLEELGPKAELILWEAKSPCDRLPEPVRSEWPITDIGLCTVQQPVATNAFLIVSSDLDRVAFAATVHATHPQDDLKELIASWRKRNAESSDCLERFKLRNAELDKLLGEFIQADLLAASTKKGVRESDQAAPCCPAAEAAAADDSKSTENQGRAKRREGQRESALPIAKRTAKENTSKPAAKKAARLSAGQRKTRDSRLALRTSGDATQSAKIFLKDVTRKGGCGLVGCWLSSAH